MVRRMGDEFRSLFQILLQNAPSGCSKGRSVVAVKAKVTPPSGDEWQSEYAKFRSGERGGAEGRVLLPSRAVHRLGCLWYA